VLAHNYRLLILIRISVIRGVTKGTRGGGGDRVVVQGQKEPVQSGNGRWRARMRPVPNRGGWGWLLGGAWHSAGQRDRGGRPLIGGPQPK
jgi:hypothetical protein